MTGYHMAVVAGVVLFAVRALLARFPTLTAGFPIKKWAAAAAVFASAFYLLLSGRDVATQRSFYMTAVVLIAVRADRRAITFRTPALAAMIVLVIAPEALVHPSFQLSFEATLGLVALVQFGMPKLFASSESSTTARVAMWGGRELMTLLLASLVAGLARAALWPTRQSRRDARGLGGRNAGRPHRTCRHAVWLRWPLVATDKDRHRLDDCDDAMGCRFAPARWDASQRSASVR
jgi:ComEC/Rec2-related protein